MLSQASRAIARKLAQTTPPSAFAQHTGVALLELARCPNTSVQLDCTCHVHVGMGASAIQRP